MKKIPLLFVLILSTAAGASTREQKVHGYTKKDSTKVEG